MQSQGENSAMDSHKPSPFPAPAAFDANRLQVLDMPAAALAPEAHEAIKELMHEGESSNTRSSYQSAMRYWAAWHLLRLGQPMQLPLQVSTVLQFIIDHALRQSGVGLLHEMPPEIDEALVAAGYKGKKVRLRTARWCTAWP